MRLFLIICVSLTYLGFVNSALISVNGVANTQGCTTTGSNSTCVAQMKTCNYVSNSPCSQTTVITNEQICTTTMNTKCNSTCTQSTNSLCSTSKIATIFKKGLSSTSPSVNGIKAVYCNGLYLVIISNGMPNHADTLTAVPRPPGGSGASYASACVTRSHYIQSFTWKIPLTPVKLSTASVTNNIAAFTANGAPYLTYGGATVAALPEDGPTGVTITGCPIYPVFNNVGGLTWLSCEVDQCNAHAGQGLDYHYHGDPFGENCMYSSSDYSSTTAHPPIIGFSRDGYIIYGRYLDDTAEGYSDALDDCGGHTHTTDTGGYGYHYHAQVVTMTVPSGYTGNGLTAGNTYTAYLNGPYKCWRGDISGFPGFWTKSDYAAPCCSMSNSSACGACVGYSSCVSGSEILKINLSLNFILLNLSSIIYANSEK